jgi:tetratricopeptide (TPR) repeat protein
MGLFDKLFGRKGEVVTLRDRATAERFPLQLWFDRRGKRRADVGPCGDCGGRLDEVVITTGGEHGDRELWRAYPLAVDGWRCRGCGALTAPRFLEPDEATELGKLGAQRGEAGLLDEAELAFRRLANSWTAWAPGRFNLAMLYQERIRAEERSHARPEVIAAYREVREAQLRDALRGEGMPLGPRAFELARALLERGADDEAIALVDELRARGDLQAADAAVPDDLDRFVRQRFDLYDRGADAIKPYMILDGAPRPTIDAAARRRIERGIDDLLAHARANPASFSALWLAGKAYQSLGDHEAFARELGRSFAIAPDNANVAREYAAALLALRRHADAVDVSRAACAADPLDDGLVANLAVAQLLAGHLDDAAATIKRALARDAADPITRRIATVLDDVRAGRRPQPESLDDLQRPR